MGIQLTREEAELRLRRILFEDPVEDERERSGVKGRSLENDMVAIRSESGRRRWGAKAG